GAEADVAQLVHQLVGQRAGLGDQADLAGAGDVRRDDARVGLAGADDTRAVRADDAGLVALGLGVRPEVRRVVHRDALGDHHGERDLGVDRLDHRVLGELRRHEQHRHVGAGLRHGFLDGAEHGQLLAADLDLLACLAGVDTADHVGAGGEHAGGVLGALGARHALDDDLGVLVEEDSHRCQTPAFASSAALSAAASMVSTRCTPGSFASSRILRPSSALLPSSRTTSGRVICSPRSSSSLKACTIPLATASHAVTPPKTLTNTLLTSGSLRMTSRPAAMTSAEAPPPMWRKFAGFTPPCFSPA